MTNAEGVIIYFVTDYQAAVELGGQAYRKRYGKPPVYVALPSCVDPTTLELWTLQVCNTPASKGTVQILGQNRNGDAVCAKCGLPVLDPRMAACSCGYDGKEPTR